MGILQKKIKFFKKKIINHLELNSILNKNQKIPHQTGPIYFTKMWNLFVKKR